MKFACESCGYFDDHDNLRCGMCEGEVINPKVRRVLIENGVEIIINSEDYDIIKNKSWRVLRSGASRKPKVRCKNISLARFVLGLEDSTLKVFHKNDNYLDFRKANLQLETQGIATHRTRKQAGMTSQYKGVYFEKNRRKWRATIIHQGNRFYIGRFNTEKEAALAYDEKSRELYGTVAFLNIEI